MLYIAFVWFFFVDFLFTYNKNHLSKKNNIKIYDHAAAQANGSQLALMNIMIAS